MFELASYTPLLLNYAMLCLERIYREGYKFIKAGVVLMDIIPEELQEAYIKALRHGVNGNEAIKSIEGYFATLRQFIDNNPNRDSTLFFKLGIVDLEIALWA